MPRIPASAGALIFDASGRLLILKPTYKRGWTLPGGQVDPGRTYQWVANSKQHRPFFDKDEASAVGREIAPALGAEHVVHNIDGSVGSRTIYPGGETRADRAGLDG